MICGVFSSQDSAAITCAYPLDASAAELIGIGLSGKLTMSGGDQTGQMTLPAGIQSLGMSVSGLESGTSIPFNVGAVAVETQFTMPTIGGTTPQVVASMGFYESGVTVGAPVFRAQVAALDSGAFTQSVYIGSTQVYTAAAASGSVRCSFRVTAGVLRVWFDGVEATLLPSAAVSDVAMYPIAYALKASGLDAGDTGKTTTIQLITDAASMTGTYPPGTTDMCGNPV